MARVWPEAFPKGSDAPSYEQHAGCQQGEARWPRAQDPRPSTPWDPGYTGVLVWLSAAPRAIASLPIMGLEPGPGYWGTLGLFIGPTIQLVTKSQAQGFHRFPFKI